MGENHFLAASQGDVQTCIDACADMVGTSEDCADACLRLGGEGEVTDCFLASLDSAEVCTSMIRLLGWRFRSDGHTTTALLVACQEAAATSIAACTRMTGRQPEWASCVTSGRRVVAACTTLLNAY